jgi:hypothetical protein
MNNLSFLAKMMMLFGAFLLIGGVVLFLLGKFLPSGMLPGDIFYQKGNFTFFFPVVTCLILSLIFTLLLNILFRW